MATATTNPSLEGKTPSAGVVVPLCPPGQTASGSSTDHPADSQQEPSQRNTLQALLAFSALHEQVRRRKTLETRRTGDDGAVSEAEREEGEQFTLDEVLQLVADRAVAITGADGLAIALAENNEVVLRAAAGTVRPDLGARIDRDSAFSGACFRTAQIVSCDDTETDARVNLQACRRLGARSMVAVPLCGRRRGIGLLQAFSAQPFGFNDSDVRNLSLLAELVLGALTPEDEDRFAESAQVAATKLEAAPSEPEAVPVAEPGMPAEEPDDPPAWHVGSAGVHCHRLSISGGSLVEAEAVAVGQQDGADGKDGAETDGHRGEGHAGWSIRRDGSESRQHQSRRDFQWKPGDQFTCQAAGIVEISPGHRNPALVVGGFEYGGSQS